MFLVVVLTCFQMHQSLAVALNSHSFHFQVPEQYSDDFRRTVSVFKRFIPRNFQASPLTLLSFFQCSSFPKQEYLLVCQTFSSKVPLRSHFAVFLPYTDKFRHLVA